MARSHAFVLHLRLLPLLHRLEPRMRFLLSVPQANIENFVILKLSSRPATPVSSRPRDIDVFCVILASCSIHPAVFDAAFNANTKVSSDAFSLSLSSASTHAREPSLSSGQVGCSASGKLQPRCYQVCSATMPFLYLLHPLPSKSSRTLMRYLARICTMRTQLRHTTSAS